MSARVNIDQPRWDQSTYVGRAKHFFTVTNPFNLLCTKEQLEKSREIVSRYRKGEDIPGLTTEELWKHKHIYDSAFHPDTGEKVLLIGRMSAQVPMNMMITGGMLAFYKSTPQVVLWQWINQSFNAVVNYSNRSGPNPVSPSQLGVSYVCATSGALVTALGLNSMVKTLPTLVGRFVPFCAVAAANCVNIPLMRMQEIQNGIPVYDENGKKIGQSKIAAKWAISMVVLSRIAMATPGMIIPPIMINSLDRRGFFVKYPWANLPLSVAMCGVMLSLATPACCALFPQKASLDVSALEPELQEMAKKVSDGKCKTVWYNKGL